MRKHAKCTLVAVPCTLVLFSHIYMAEQYIFCLSTNEYALKNNYDLVCYFIPDCVILISLNSVFGSYHVLFGTMSDVSPPTYWQLLQETSDTVVHNARNNSKTCQRAIKHSHENFSKYPNIIREFVSNHLSSVSHLI